MLTFRRAYFVTVVVVAALFVALWFGRELIFWLHGFDRSLIDSASAEAFRAYAETASARSILLRATEIADIALLVLSVVAVIRRREGKREIPRWAIVGMLALALVIGMILLTVQLTPPPVILGVVGR